MSGSFFMRKIICFCGSFKFYRQMQSLAGRLKKTGFTVIVPQPSHVRYGHMPQLLKDKYDEKILTRWEGEGALSHLENIRKSDFIYIFNKNAYLGPAVTVEIGYALALKKKIFSYSKIKDITVINFVEKVLPPGKLINYLNSFSKYGRQ